MTRKVASACGMVAALALLFSCQDLRPIKGKGRVRPAGSTGSASGNSGTKGPKVKVEFYVMSKCPFGVQAEDGFKPVLDEIGDRIDYHVDFIVSENNGSFNSLHGEPEAKGDIIQLCARKQYPEQSKWVAFNACMNKSWRNIPNNWESCAQQEGMDVNKLKSCVTGKEGKDLLRASMQRAQQRQASGSPTIFIGDKPYSGGRSKNDFMRAICTNMEGEKPQACSKIPPEVEVKAIVLNDKRCTECNTQGLIGNLRGRFFPKLTVRNVDYASPEGKKLYKELKLEKLPVYLFEAGVEKASKYAQIQRWMEPVGKYKKLKVPAKFDPTAEICTNKVDDTGNGKVDCADPTCDGKIECRPEKKNKVDVFVMSQCPFGIKAENAMKEVLDNFKGKVDFGIHYIADKGTGARAHRGFTSLHGGGEVDENIRQLCAKKYYGANNKYLDYIWCRNKNIRSDDWKQCAKGGIKASVIEKCATGKEGEKLHAEDIKLAKKLDISASPTWLANNRFKFSGVAADAIKGNICKHNSGLANCDKKLSNNAEVKGSCN